MSDHLNSLDNTAEGGVWLTVKAFLRRVFVEWLIDYFKWVLSAVAVLMLYSLGVSEDWLPNPFTRDDSRISEASRDVPQLRYPLNASSIQYVDDGTDAGELGDSLHLSIIPNILEVSQTLDLIELQYGLTNLSSTSGTKKSVALEWALRLPSTDWVSCEQTGLQFNTKNDLEKQIALVLNNSLAASEKTGELKCT